MLALLIAALAALWLGLWRLELGRQALRAIERATYDLDAAMELAGAQVPSYVESFYFFVLEPDSGDESAELAGKLAQAAGEGEFLGIAGPDAEHNRSVLLAALALLARQNLAGLVIIYVGPPAQEAELQERVGAAGAELRFAPYVPADIEAI